MAALTLRRISNPSSLKRIDPQHLTRLLDPYREYFASRAVVLPGLGDDLCPFDWDRLVEVFLTPDMEMPLELVETLHLVDELATPAAMDALLMAAREQGVDLTGSRSDTPLDLAILAFLRDRAFAECVHQDHAMQKKTGYVYFGSAEPLPEPQPLACDRVEQLRAELDDYYSAHRRGRHCRIFVSQRGSRTWVTVRHGDAIRRETDLEKGGIVFVYRPEVFSVVFYDATTEEIGVCASSDRERNLYRKLMGKYLFGFEETFLDGGKLTLDPLLKSGRSCLACSDVYGLEWVKLIEVNYVRDMLENPKEMRQASDIFDCYRNEIVPPGARLLSAKFKVKFRGAKTARRLSVSLPNEVRHSRESDTVLTEQWLRARGFLRPRDMFYGNDYR